MKNRNTRIFLLEGKNYKFNVSVFMRLFVVKAAEFNMKLGEHEQFLADQLLVSKEAIHNWRNNLNGPSGIEIIQKIAEVWKVDFYSLIKEIKEIGRDDVSMNGNNETMLVREAIKKVYVAMVDFIEFFEKTNGLQIGDNNESNNELFSIACAKRDYAVTVLRKEMLDIPKDLHDKLYGFINDRFNYVLQGEPLEDEDARIWEQEVICVVEETYELLQEILVNFRVK